MFHLTCADRRQRWGGGGDGGERSTGGRRRRLCTTAETSLGPPLAHLNTRSVGRRDRADTRQNIKENTPASEAERRLKPQVPGRAQDHKKELAQGGAKPKEKNQQQQKLKKLFGRFSRYQICDEEGGQRARGNNGVEIPSAWTADANNNRRNR